MKRFFLISNLLFLGLMESSSADFSHTSFNFEINNIKGIVLTVGQFEMDAASLSSEATAADIQHYKLDEDPYVFPVRALYVETVKNRIVIEPAGMDYDRGRLVRELKSNGISPASIDTVIITHAHNDHFNGVIQDDGSLSFPNAKIYIQKGEWDYWCEASDEVDFLMEAFHSTLKPLKNRIQFVKDGEEIVPGVKGIVRSGHSPHLMTVHIAECIAYTGDAFLRVFNIEHPDWTATWEHDKVQIVEGRMSFLDLVCNKDYLVIGTHFEGTGVGKVKREGIHYRWDQLE